MCEVVLCSHICNEKILAIVIPHWSSLESFCISYGNLACNKFYNNINLDFFLDVVGTHLTQLHQKESDAEYHHCIKSDQHFQSLLKDDFSSVALSTFVLLLNKKIVY